MIRQNLGIWGSGFVKTILEIDDSLYCETMSAKETDAAYELRQWFKSVDKAVKSAPPRVSALMLLNQDRRRLETR